MLSVTPIRALDPLKRERFDVDRNGAYTDE
jgi:hypothetical protein